MKFHASQIINYMGRSNETSYYILLSDNIKNFMTRVLQRAIQFNNTKQC